MLLIVRIGHVARPTTEADMQRTYNVMGLPPLLCLLIILAVCIGVLGVLRTAVLDEVRPAANGTVQGGR